MRELCLIGLTGPQGTGKSIVAELLLGIVPGSVQLSLEDRAQELLEKLNPWVRVRSGRWIFKRRKWMTVQQALEKHETWEEVRRVSQDARQQLERLQATLTPGYWTDALWARVEAQIRGHWLMVDPSDADLGERLVIVVPDVQRVQDWKFLTRRVVAAAEAWKARHLLGLWRIDRPGHRSWPADPGESLEAEVTSQLLNNSTTEDLKAWVLLHLEKLLATRAYCC